VPPDHQIGVRVSGEQRLGIVHRARPQAQPLGLQQGRTARRAAEEAGRDPAALKCLVCAPSKVSDDFAAARERFSELARLFPQYPAGAHYLAGALMFETLYKTRRLHASLYSANPFYMQGDDKVDPEAANRFRALTRDAQSLALARLKQHPKDTEALYYLGNVAALKATFEEAVERRHSAALADGCEVARSPNWFQTAD